MTTVQPRLGQPVEQKNLFQHGVQETAVSLQRKPEEDIAATTATTNPDEGNGRPYSGVPSAAAPTKDLCAECGGPLKDANGVFYQKLLEDRRSARVIFVCERCKRGTK